MIDTDTIPASRRTALGRVLDALASAERIVLTTHVNADGDGAGSEAALASWLAQRGKSVHIVNPTPFPELFRYLVDDSETVADFGGDRAAAALRAADLLVVVDTSEPRRIARVLKAWNDGPAAVIDHHPPADGSIAGVAVLDPTACATGELIYDLFVLAGDGAAEWPGRAAEALYTAIVTDTGSFRFANTTPRCHLVAADLMRRGVDPEAVYRHVFATVPFRRVRLLRYALEHLNVDAELPISWISIPRDVVAELGNTSEDMDGLIEHARSIEGTEVAMLFRELADGSTKISFRSNGDVDVNALARKFGGGGHVKASGALVGGPLETTRDEVLAAARKAVQMLEKRSKTS